MGLTYDAAGSHKTANGVWRSGVLLGSLGEANTRLEGRIGDCRGWGRYIGRVYRGASKKTMVVIETYFPDATYEADNVTREDYSQTLGARAAAALPGVSVARWKHGAAPPKPALVQTKRPKRLLIDDLTMHLRPYACDVDCTIIIMGDFNTDLTHLALGLRQPCATDHDRRPGACQLRRRALACGLLRVQDAQG